MGYSKASSCIYLSLKQLNMKHEDILLQLGVGFLVYNI